ncbi:MAG: hypothetical protein M1836_001305 [Candelina mexicana]|nr:MAG: hypothetical protein M1836_001305 [Candelina mexicana]
MVLDHNGRQRSTSPVSSGRASPVPRQPTARAEDNLHRKDKSYRRYTSNVERALSLFDNTLQEWADYISFLGRLLKALQTHPPNITALPRTEVVAKRLAQCLNPSLPSGVHQKTLELYAYIFSMIGKDALARDLALYLPGLSSTLSFASLSVRPYFLSLVESHLLVLHASALRPALKALILALLPGLEDETSEDFERTFRILEGFKKVIKGYQLTESKEDDGYGDEYFWQCFFLSSITSPGRRQGALSFLNRKLPKLGGIRLIDDKGPKRIAELSPAAEAVVYPEPGLLVRCFAAGLSDEQLLIQRGFLDLLVTHLPLDSPVLQDRVTPMDLDRLITAAVGVVGRREMSLNRRLWTWLLGPETKSRSGGDVTPTSSASFQADSWNSARETLGTGRTQYFSDNGLQSLIRSVRAMINRNYHSAVARARPFRICLSLMDRWEIGGLFVPEIFLSVIQSVQKYKAIAPTKEDFGDVLRSASIFFDGVESGLIWGELVRLIATALGCGQLDDQSRLDKLELVEFVIKHFNIREEEMLITHMPIVTLATLTIFERPNLKQGEAEGSGNISKETLDCAFKIADYLVTAIPQRAFLMDSSDQRTGFLAGSIPLQDLPNQKILDSIRSFYVRKLGNIEVSTPPFPNQVTGELLLRQAASLVNRNLQADHPASTIEIQIKLLTDLIVKIPRFRIIHQEDLFSAIQQYLVNSDGFSTPASSFATFSAIVSLVTTLISSKASLSFFSTRQYMELTHLLVCRAWKYLSPTTPKYHVETVRCLWRLQSVDAHASNRGVEASLSALLSASDKHQDPAVHHVDSASRFAVLWTHSVQAYSGDSNKNMVHPLISDGNRESSSTSRVQDFEVMLTRPLLLLLDTLATEGTQLFIFAKDWIENLPSVHKLFQVLAMKILAFEHLVPMSVPLQSENSVSRQSAQDPDDPDECLYYIKTLSNILRWSSENVWFSVANQKTSELDGSLSMSLQSFFAEVCLRLIAPLNHLQPTDSENPVLTLHRAALCLLKQLLLNPYSAALCDEEMEHPLVECLHSSMHVIDPSIQVLLLDVIYAALKLKVPTTPPPATNGHRRTASKDTIRSSSYLPVSIDRSDKEQAPPAITSPPPNLVKCIQDGISSTNSRPALDSWITFLAKCLPLYSETTFQILIPLVECLCKQIRETFAELRATFRDTGSEKPIAPESTLILLLNGLEQTLARAHERLRSLEVKSMNNKSPEQPQGFFGNMVSGVFSSDEQVSRGANANDRLTVLLSFQDTIRICFSIWSWGGYGPDDVCQDPASHASFTYISLRMRNRARRILEHLFAAESLECLETLAVIWRGSTSILESAHSNLVFNLLHVLDGSRPKNTIPAVFNAIYSRTNPKALEPMRKSTLTSDLTDTDVVAFLVEYARSLDDDAMDEIWIDCMTFLRDVLANPFPHRQTLPRLLEFTAILGEKVDNTNFGEQRKMRRDLGDLFTRLLTASFTTKPINFSQDTIAPLVSETPTDGRKLDKNNMRPQVRPDDIVAILIGIVPHLPTIIYEAERIVGITSTISTNVIGPTIRSKLFPENISKSVLDLLYQLAKVPNSSKSWRKDIADAFYDPKFFANTLTLVDSTWLPLLRQWALVDKDRLPELLSRISSPTTAGIMFGVGASSARLEADRRTQLNLRRIAVLILAAADDSFVTDFPSLEEKLVELLAATAASSPSSATRPEIYMVLRALVLKTSTVHLAPLWPIISSELHNAISSVFPEEKSNMYSAFGVLQACKLLDTLLTIAPDDFQLHEWLFITDTIDAVYRPMDWNPVAIVDELSEELGSSAILPSLNMGATQDSTQDFETWKKPLLNLGGIKDIDKDDIVGKVLKPFFSQLSIYAFESTYAMSTPDWQTCKEELLSDIFDESTIIG